MQTKFLIPAALATIVASVPGAAHATSTTCTTSTVCAEYINTYTSSSPVSGGVAIHGEANGGIGIRGTSVSNVGFYGASGSGIYVAPGVEGESTNTSGLDAGGAFGLASIINGTGPAFGAIGLGKLSGLLGQTQNAGTSSSAPGYGVQGNDFSTSSGSSSGDYNAGVFGGSYYGTAMLAEANGTPTKGVYSTAPVGVYSVAKERSGTPNAASYAFFGESDDFGLELADTSNGATTFVNTPLFFLVGNGPTNGGGSYYISYSGNEYLSGTLTTSKGGPYVRTTGSSGAAVREYTDRTTTPQVEDFGDGRLVNGRAYVPIDARLADTIDRRTEYHVFVTPEGDCNGLFVTQKSPSGFVVRELRGGRSSLAFEYRIVAKPVDENGTRLAAMPAETLPKEIAVGNGAKVQRIAPPLSIEDDLKRRLGQEGYAKALAALRARLAGR